MTYFLYKESLYCGRKRQAQSSLVIDQLKGDPVTSYESVILRLTITLPSHVVSPMIICSGRHVRFSTANSTVNYSLTRRWTEYCSRSYTLNYFFVIICSLLPEDLWMTLSLREHRCLC